MTKMILVDDEKIILNSLSKYITGQLPDFKICGLFYNGLEALEFLQKNPSLWVDIVLTDICMPKMDGLELARELCNRMPGCVVIILSGFSEFEYAQNAIKYNVFNYMLKPLDYRELKKVLIEAQATAAARKKSAPAESDLSEEEMEVFFVDLFCGSVFSTRELKERFAALHFPFSLEESEGYLVKLSLTEESLAIARHYEIDRLIVSLRNALQFSIADTHFYFMRKAAFDYYYVAVSRRMPDSGESLRLKNNIREFIALDCVVDLYHHFSSFKDLVQKKTPVAIPCENGSQSNDALIQKAIDYINANFDKELSRETVADAVFLSPSHFSYLFKQKTGISFMDYVTNVRMQKSVELLKTKMRINDIAEKVGYQNRNRFIINFRQYTSYTPTEYRRNILSMEDAPDEK